MKRWFRFLPVSPLPHLALILALALLVGSCGEAGIFHPTGSSSESRAEQPGGGPLVSSGGASGPQSPAGGTADGSSDESGVPFQGLASFTRPAIPQPEMARSTIGAEGGSLRLGDFEVVVPAGAVSRPTLFTIRRPVDRRNRDRVVVELRPHHVRFAVPVTVRMPLAGTTAEDLTDPAIVRWGGEAWIDRPTRIIEDGGRLETRTYEFSFWGSRLFGELTSGG